MSAEEKDVTMEEAGAVEDGAPKEVSLAVIYLRSPITIPTSIKPSRCFVVIH